MKRILALLLALLMLLAMTACGKDEESTPTGESTGATTNSTESTTNTTESTDPTDGTQTGVQGTTESTAGGETAETAKPSTATLSTTTPATMTPSATTSPTKTPATVNLATTVSNSTTPATTKPSATTKPLATTTSPTTEASHTHSYSSKVTTAATCGKDGVKIFTCSCGDSYTEKITATGQHSWSSWKTETCALVNRKGTDKRTCSTCSATETRENTEYVVYNSFYDPGLGPLFYWGFNYDGSLRAYSLLEYAPHKYSEFVYKENSTDTIYDALAKIFVIDSSFKDKMRAEGKSNPYYLGYNEANDTFTFKENNMGSVGRIEALGYIHNGGKEYTVYYRFEESVLDESPQIYKVVLEFNRTDSFNINNWSLNGEENKYLSFEKVSSVPSDLTK